MPKNKDLKRHVRARMQKTGESYTAARARLTEKKTTSSGTVPVEAYAEVAGMKDETVRARTGKTWKQWVRWLDSIGGRSMAHKEMASRVHAQNDVSGWWAQTVTIGYERIRGLREKGQTRGGDYQVNKSRTYAVPLAALYKAFDARTRKRWLGDVDLKVKKATREKSMRITWSDGTPLDVYFWDKGAGKSQVQLQLRSLPSRKEADRARADWTERLAALGRVLAGK